MMTTIEDMVCRYVNGVEPYVTAHFDEIESINWKGYCDTEIIEFCRRSIDELRSKSKEIWPKPTVAVISVPLECVDTPPVLGIVHGWKFIQNNWNTFEPPSLYLISSDSFALQCATSENYIAPALDLGSWVNGAYVHYSRDINEIRQNHVYYGNVLMLTDLSLSPEGIPEVRVNWR